MPASPFLRRVHSRLLLAGLAAVVVIVDQVTKSVAQRYLAHHPVQLFGPFQLRLVYNSGAAFSILRGLGPALAILAVLAVAAIFFATRLTSSRLTIVGGGLVAGGALGNLADRIFRHNGGAVIDFIYTRYWPTFNVADSAITVGVVLIVWAMMRKDRNRAGG